MDQIESVIVTAVKGIVDLEDAVRVVRHEGDQTTVYNLYVDRTDIGKVIGKKGVMAESLRRIIFAMAVKHNRRCVLEIVI